MSRVELDKLTPKRKVRFEMPEKLKILVVDGSPMLDIFRRYLVNLGCEVVTAVDTQAAIEQLQLITVGRSEIKAIFVNDRSDADRSEINTELISVVRSRWPDKKIVAITVCPEAFDLERNKKINFVITRDSRTTNLSGFEYSLRDIGFLGSP